MKRNTKLGALFMSLRGRRPLREIEELTGINRETWRSIEIGRILEPDSEILAAARTLPEAPPLDAFLAAIRDDHETRLMAAYGST